MKQVAVILAGGSGQRMGEGIPKQFLKIRDKEVLAYTLAVFDRHELIDEIVVVSHPEHMQKVETIVEQGNYGKVKHILSGGKERCYSSLAAIEAYADEVNLIFHDAVRPLVSERVITDCIHALAKYNAVGVAVPTTDTILQVNERNEIVQIPPRVNLRNAQTPQGFKRGVIKRAYELALRDVNFKTTDDCGVVLTYLPEEPIYVVQGDQYNIKLTYQEDLVLLESLLALRYRG